MSALNVLGMDYGASNGRGILGKFDGSRLDLQCIHRFPNNSVTVFNNIYWDILFLYNQLIESLRKCRNICESLNSLAIDTWALDFGILDSNGNLLGNVHTYRDPRANSIWDEARRVFDDYEMFQKTGIPPMGIATVYQLIAMKRQQEGIMEKADKLLFVPNLLAYLLTGEYSCDSTIASTSMLYSPFLNNWSKDILQAYGIPDILPEFIAHGETIGKVVDNLALETGIQKVPVISIAHHDTASAFITVPEENKEEVVYISCGTWSIIGTNIEKPVVSRQAFENLFCNEMGYNNDIILAKNVTGLFILQECIREWELEGYEVDYRHFEESARKSSFETYIDVCHSEFALPGRMEDKVVDHCNKFGEKPPQTKEEVYKSITLGLAVKYKEVIETLKEITGRDYKKIHIIGGGARDTYLCETLCRLTGMRVIAGPYEGTVAGNIFAQLIAHGEIKGMQEVVDIIKKSFSLDYYD